MTDDRQPTKDTVVGLSGARALVLGGSGVLGSALARRLHASGAAVVLAGRDAERLQRRATEISSEVRSVQFDLTVPAHAAHVVETAVAMLGGLDGVINAAGVVAFGPLAELDDAVLDELVATDLVGPLRVIRHALPHLEGGFVVNVTGVVAETPIPGMVAYSAVKAALSAATRALAKEVRRKRIHVLDVRPPHTETGLASRPLAGSAPAMPRGLDPGDVADAILAALTAGDRELAASQFE